MANVIVYTSSVCPWCVKLKEFLNENNVEYEERNAQENPAYAQELLQKSGQLGVPVADIEGTIIIGFNVPKLKETLKLS